MGTFCIHHTDERNSNEDMDKLCLILALHRLGKVLPTFGGFFPPKGYPLAKILFGPKIWAELGYPHSSCLESL